MQLVSESRPGSGFGRVVSHPDAERHYEQRGQIATEMRRLDSVAAVITYSDEARASSDEAHASSEGVGDALFDYVYGSNLEHAFLLARAACRSAGTHRILLVTYSLPSAHHNAGSSFFSLPPIEESLRAAEREAGSIAADRLRLDVFVLVGCLDPDQTRMINFFQKMAGLTNGRAIPIDLHEDADDVIDKWIRGSSSDAPS